jgi:hypothetical protein
MSKKNKKTTRSIAKPSSELRSYASIYGATLAKQVAAELNPRDAKSKTTKKLRA